MQRLVVRAGFGTATTLRLSGHRPRSGASTLSCGLVLKKVGWSLPLAKTPYCRENTGLVQNVTIQTGKATLFRAQQRRHYMVGNDC